MAASTYFVPTRFTWRFGGQAVRFDGAVFSARHGRGGCRCGQWCPPASTTPLPPPTPPSLQVHLCGSFTRWVETVPMAPVPGVAGEFSVVVHLPPG